MTNVNCPQCGRIIAQRQGDTVTIKHHGRTTVAKAPVETSCQVCGCICQVPAMATGKDWLKDARGKAVLK